MRAHCILGREQTMTDVNYLLTQGAVRTMVMMTKWELVTANQVTWCCGANVATTLTKGDWLWDDIVRLNPTTSVDKE